MSYSSHKFEQKILVSAVISALATITFGVSAAELTEEHKDYQELAKLQANSQSSESNSYAVAIETKNKYLTINAPKGVEITFADGMSSSRYYGVATQADSRLILNGNLTIDFQRNTPPDAEVRAVRAHGGDIEVNGDLHVDATGKLLTVGIEAWSDSTVNVKGSQTVLNVTSTEGRAMGINMETAAGGNAINIHSKLNVNVNGKTALGLHSSGGNSISVEGSETRISVASDDGLVYAIENYNNVGSEISVTSDAIFLNVTNGPSADQQTKAVLTNLGTTNLSGALTIDVDGGSGTAGKATYGIDVQGTLTDAHKSVVNLKDGDLLMNVDAKGTAYGISSSGGRSEVNLLGSNSEIHVTSTDKDAVGIYSAYGASLTNHTNVALDVKAKSSAYGVLMDMGTENGPKLGGNASFGALTAEVTSTDGNAYGISNSMDNKKLENNDPSKYGNLIINGNTSMKAVAEKGDAFGLDVSGIHAKAALKGANEITAESKESSKTATAIRLDKSTVVISGKTTATAIGEQSVGIDQTGGNLSIGADLTATGTTYAYKADSSAKTSVTGSEAAPTGFTLNGKVAHAGSLNLTSADLKLNGSESTLNTVVANQSTSIELGKGKHSFASLTSDDTAKMVLNDLTADSVTITQQQGKMSRVASAAANDQFGSAVEAAQALVKSFTSVNTTDEYSVEQSKVNDRVDFTVNDKGEIENLKTTKNQTLTAFGSINALSVLGWRHEVNSLSKRMGELRDSASGIGSWVRLYGSEQEYGAQSVTSKNTTIQVGSDVSVGDWKLGIAANYTDGEATYDNGDADSKSYGVALYGTWFVPCGAYVDLIARYSRLDNDFAVNGMNGAFDNNALSVAAETGYKFSFIDDQFFVEPQVAINYGRVQGANFKADNGVEIDQDNFTTFTGRAGLRAGLSFPEKKGTVYARVSVVHDFEGDLETEYRYGPKARNYTNDDLGGTWMEYGVGANFSLTYNTYTYVDLERTDGGEVKENYRWNVGLRHVW